MAARLGTLVKVLLVLAIGVIGLGAPGAMSAPAHAAGTASISGTVTDGSAAPLEDIYVSAIVATADGWSFAGDAWTDADGHYAIGDLEAGTYRLQFTDSDGSYLDEWHDDRPDQESATDIPVGAGEQVTGVDAALATASHITGTVTDGAGAGLVDVEVYAYPANDPDTSTGWAQTAPDGGYDMGGLRPGTYRVEFIPGEDHLSEWYDDEPGFATATDVVVAAAGSTSGIDAQLAAAAHLTGTVTADVGGAPVASADLTLYAQDAAGEWTDIDSDYSDSDGTYSFGGLAAGTYRLGVDQGYGSKYRSEFYSDAKTVESAQDIVIGAGLTVTRNVGLAELGHITGTVRGPGGTPLQYIRVLAQRYDPASAEWLHVSAYVVTNASGGYDVPGLVPGRYRLQFTDSHASSPGYLSEWWDDAPTRHQATDIVVPDVPGAVVSGRDATLAAGGHITGTVTNGAGAGLAGVYVTAYRDIAGEWTSVAGAMTNSSGAYDVKRLPAGTYAVQFSGSTSYLGEYYDDRATLDTADPVTLGSGEAESGVDAVLSPAASISGTVSSTAGGSVEGAYVRAYRQVGTDWEFAAGAGTDDDGAFSVAGLPGGSYRLHYDADGFTNEWWDDAETEAGATPVVLAAGGSVTGRDAALSPQPVIAGRVTDAASAGIASVEVTAYTEWGGSWDYYDSVSTDPTGAYRVAVPPGTYRLGFAPTSGDHAPEYFNDKPSLAGADDITVTTADVTGRNAVLAAGGHITGRVTDASGAGLWDVGVVALQQVDGDWVDVGYGQTRSDGSFDLGGLATGSYRLLFEPGSGPYVGEYYQDVYGVGAATDVPVTAGATTSGIDAVLGAARVTGRVTGGGGGLPDITVTAYRLDGDRYEEVRSTYTDASGNYALGLLVPGSYKLEFSDELNDELGGGYAPQWWDNASTKGTARAFSLADGATSTGKDAALVGSSLITGMVRSTAATYLSDVVVTAYRLVDGGYEWQGAALTDRFGGYVIDGLPAGTYRVRFQDLEDGHADQWWDNKPTRGSATEVVLAAHAAAADVDAVMGTTAPPDSVENLALPTIRGAPREGATLTADPGEWDPADAALTYQWLADGEAISGATNPTYEPGSGAVGKAIRVRVTGSKPPLIPSSATSEPTAPVAPPTTVVNSAPPTISGTPVVGATLTADPGTWSPSDATFAYEWLADDAVIAGATDPTYTPVAGDVGKAIKVRVTGSRSGLASSSATSAATDAVTRPPVVNTALPTIGGTPQVGSTLTAAPGTWTPADVAVAYQWLADGSVVAGATGATYVPVDADVGKAIRVRVTGSRAGYDSATATSAPTGPVTAGPTVANTALPTISGTPQVGSTLTATAGTWTPADVAVAYQWLVDDAVVAGATGATYVPVAGDVGKALRVRVSASRTGYTSGAATSLPTASVLPADPSGAVTNTAAPTVAGTARLGVPLTAGPGGWMPADVSLAYQWLADGSPVGGATATTFVPGAAQVGQRISVRVTGSKAGLTPASATSAPTGPVAAGTITNPVKPAIKGKAKVGKKLKVKPGAFAPAGATVTYQWCAKGKAIKRATGTTLKLTKKQKGKKITVTVTVTMPGYTSLTVVTAPTKKVK